jgi:protein-arginine kinase activator protein McsA
MITQKLLGNSECLIIFNQQINTMSTGEYTKRLEHIKKCPQSVQSSLKLRIGDKAFWTFAQNAIATSQAGKSITC